MAFPLRFVFFFSFLCYCILIYLRMKSTAVVRTNVLTIFQVTNNKEYHRWKPAGHQHASTAFAAADSRMLAQPAGDASDVSGARAEIDPPQGAALGNGRR